MTVIFEIDKCMRCHKNNPTKIVRTYRLDGGYDETRCLCDECCKLIMNDLPIDPWVKGDETCLK
jgi:hypothetical protein